MSLCSRRGGVQGRNRRGAGRPDAQTGRGRTHVDRENRGVAAGLYVFALSDQVSVDSDIASKESRSFETRLSDR